MDLEASERTSCIDIDIEKFRLREPDYDKLIEIYTKLEFNSFLKKLKITPQKNAQMFKSAEVEKTIIETADQIDKLSELQRARECISRLSAASAI